MKFSKEDKVKLISQSNWEGWGFDKAIVIRTVIKSAEASQQYIIQADEGKGATLCVKEHEITLR